MAILEGFETGRETGSTDYHGGTTSKSTIRNGMMLDLSAWNEAAGAIATAQDKPEIMDGFRLPHGVSAEAFAAKVNAIIAAATPLAADFEALGFADDSSRRWGIGWKRSTTPRMTRRPACKARPARMGGMSANIRDGLKVTKQLNVLMKNLYKTQPDKLAAWLTAAHIQRIGTSGKKKKRPTAARLRHRAGADSSGGRPAGGERLPAGARGLVAWRRRKSAAL